MVLGRLLLLLGAPGGPHMTHPVIEESEKGESSRHRRRKFSPALPLKVWCPVSPVNSMQHVALHVSRTFPPGN